MQPKLFFSTIYFFFFINVLSAHAQKQPEVQKVSLRAPAGLVVDGKMTDGDPGIFQARNSINRISYTVCNDDINLYLIIRGVDVPEVEKMAAGGVTIAVSKLTDKKLRDKKENKMVISYPVLEQTENGISNAVRIYRGLKREDSVANKIHMKTMSERFDKKVKLLFSYFAVEGSKDIASSNSSRSGSEGIVVSSGFNKNMALTYQIAIPLKLLSVTLGQDTKLSYQIKLNGFPLVQKTKNGTVAAPVGIPDDDLKPDPDFEYLHSPSSFWAEYTLALK
ncbi:hypothetical protein [Mucilaginibacter myungsuensis]|uniref:Uncharacterized protein n=1 Tax=Mucilaginibacter myungsuensis TaxID=649104 RepID=A0A929KZQ4_9SPHI|nr:hypothetical protein [Mucilaginibacter myungsuensis]MBE9664689.1 hypothetical protein [Mucilaginibacter myungsuensis]MDN3601454.1 hypothetical protein [Mucilaginibacter myungsuensis]